ncbi:uncharacterized protein LOC110979133 isoform X2 [Acanthaster planci]|uniref:Uncharacterized protein LOC110979133 isoform X2 n=1 Tax=Acanthaster planci TaxID=133434 RepID=A0A8B7YAV8_ACAPL|nr:uncharacterized protein LOC110979133 isoform X2 [Acanthaster planci]
MVCRHRRSLAVYSLQTFAAVVKRTGPTAVIMCSTLASVCGLLSQVTRQFSNTLMLVFTLVLCLASVIEGGMPAAPRNLTLVGQVLSKQVKISWVPGNPRDNLTDYVIVNRAQGSDTMTVSRIDPEYTFYTLKDLKEETSYIVYVKAAVGNVRSLSSVMLEFRTPRTEGLHRTFTTSAADLVIVVMVLALWLAALSLFVRTWRKKMSGAATSTGGTGTPLAMRLRSRYRKPWMWSQKYRPGRAYPAT